MSYQIFVSFTATLPPNATAAYAASLIEEVKRDFGRNGKVCAIFDDVDINTDLTVTASGMAGWAHFEEDMQRFSARFPDVSFVLEGDGEEALDFWKLWAKGGKSFFSPAKIVYDEPPFGFFE